MTQLGGENGETRGHALPLKAKVEAFLRWVRISHSQSEVPSFPRKADALPTHFLSRFAGDPGFQLGVGEDLEMRRSSVSRKQHSHLAYYINEVD